LESALLGLLTKTIELFDEIKRVKPSLTARNSVPIIFSGNIAQYEKSPLKIVTVALNPSSNEFAGVDHRYKLEKLNPKNLFKVCSSYFDVDSAQEVSRWFTNYEKILMSADASYFEGRRNRAIHSDMCSPIVTQKKWQKLGREDRRQLQESGLQIWKEFVRILSPDIILMSVKREYRDEICQNWTEIPISSIPTRSRNVAIGKLGCSTVVWGRARNTPFMDFNDREKIKIGETLQSLPR